MLEFFGPPSFKMLRTLKRSSDLLISLISSCNPKEMVKSSDTNKYRFGEYSSSLKRSFNLRYPINAKRGNDVQIDKSTGKSYTNMRNVTAQFTEKTNSKKHIHFIYVDPSKIEMYKCTECYFESKYKLDLKARIRNIHTDPCKVDKYICEVCDYQFKGKESLIKHMRFIHADLSEIKMHKRPECKFESKYKYGLKNHIRNVHSDPSKIIKYQCEICDSQFKERKRVLKHMRFIHAVYSKKETYKCPDCNFETKYKQTLSKHIQMIQNKSYNQEWDIICKDKQGQIQRVHSDPTTMRMFKCEECTFEFKHKWGLKTHGLAIHTDRPFQNRNVQM